MEMPEIKDFFRAKSQLIKKTTALCSMFSIQDQESNFITDYRSNKWKRVSKRCILEKTDRAYIDARIVWEQSQAGYVMMRVGSDFDDKIWILKTDNEVDEF